jgi:hypothetical protein
MIESKKERKKCEKIDLSHLADKWPSSVVARSEIKNFTGGLIAAGTMANLDSLGLGCDGVIQVGKKRAYLVKALIPWLEQYAARR